MAFDPTSAFLDDDDTQPAATGGFDPATASFDASSATEDFEADQGVLGTLKQGTKSAARAIGATANTYTGDAAGVVDKAAAQQEAPKDYRLENFYRDVEDNTKASGEDPGVLDAIGNVGKAVWDNPAGAGLAVLEQIPNSVPTLAGGFAGMKAGAALGTMAGGPVGAGIGGVVGGLAGMFLGNAAIETGHKAMSAADDGEFTPEEMDQAKREGAIKGGVITGVDAVTLGLGGAVSGAMQRTTRSALEAATRKALIDQGVDVADEAAVLAARSNPQVSAAVRAAQDSAVAATDTLKRRAAEAGTLLTMESVGEGVGEYLGELAATGEGNVTDAVLESLLSLGQSGAETAWNMSRKREQRGLWEEAAAIADPSLEQPTAAPAPGADPALDASAPIDTAAPEAAPVVDTSMVQPTPTAENPAPAPVPRPDPNNGPLSAAASLLPPAGAPALSAGPLSAVAPAAEQAAAQESKPQTEGPLAEAPPADPQTSTEPPATPSQRAILARRGVPAEQIQGMTRKQAGELIQQQNKTQTAGVPKPQQMDLQDPAAVEAELRDQLRYLERQAKSAGGWTAQLSRERARLRTALEPFEAKAQERQAEADAGARALKTRADDHQARVQGQDPIRGQDIDGDWMTFAEQSGTKQVPRAQMPQIKAEHRGAMVNFLNARGIEHQEESVPAASLKPTQAEFSRKKVEQAKAYTGGNRSILVSSDNHVLDGHHQWLAAREDGDDVKVIRLGAPIDQLLTAAHEFPSSTTDDAAPQPAERPQIDRSQEADRKDAIAYLRWLRDSQGRDTPERVTGGIYRGKTFNDQTRGGQRKDTLTVDDRSTFKLSELWAEMEQQRAAEQPDQAAAPAAEAEPVKWFASESKAHDFIAKKSLGNTHQVVKNGNKYEIRPLAEQQGDLIVQQPPAVEPTPAAEPAVEQVEGAAKGPLEIPEKTFADLLAEMEQGEDSIPVFVEPAKTVRSEDRAKQAGEMSVEQAQALVAEWEAHAKAQGKSRVNAGKVVLSLFDTSGEWSQPWLDAGYEVHRFDIQDGMDINDFSVEYLTEQLGIERADIILAAPPCTDFSGSGAHAWKKKDADGRTAASIELVRQTLRTVELFRPSSWALENPVGRIQKLTGLPKPTMTFQPNNFGDPYTKRTLLWGDFNTELPLANVAPTEGSKITTGLSGKDKYGRSLTPKGFAYAYFMANNLADMSAADRLAAEFKGFPRAEFQAATDAGMSEDAIRSTIEDSYNDQDIEAAREDLRNAMPTPPEPTKAPEPVANGATFGELFHGTARQFDLFDGTRLGKNGGGYNHQGRGVYLTDDRDGYARFFADKAAVKVSQTDKSLTEAEADALFHSGGTIARVKLADDAKLLDLRNPGTGQDIQDIQELFARSVGDKAVGEQLRQRVLSLGYDGLVFLEPNAIEGWELKPDAITAVVYNEAKATITGTEPAVQAEPAVDPTAFPLKEADRSYSGISHSGGARAKADQEAYEKNIAEEVAAAQAVAETPEQKAVLAAEEQALRAEYIQQYRRLMAVRAGTYSGHVAGRAKLNSRQANSRNSTYDKALDRFDGWLKSATGRIKRAVLKARTPEQLAAEQQAADAKAAAKRQKDVEFMAKLLAFKPGDDLRLGDSIITRVSKDRDGYPSSLKFKFADGSTPIDDKIDLVRVLYRGDKAALRADVDAARAAEPAAEVAPAQAAPKKKPARKSSDLEQERADYFTPGNIVKSYGGHDRVISYTPADADGYWSVTVRAVEQRDGEWVDVADQRDRVHSTQPDARELKAGPVVRAEAPAPAEPAAPAAAAAESRTPAVDAHAAVMAAVRNGDATVEQYQEGFRAVVDGEQAIRAELGKMKKDELLRAGGPFFRERYKADNKPEIINRLYKVMVDEYALGKSYGPSGYMMTRDGLANYEASKRAALADLVANQNAETLAAYAAEVAEARAEYEQKRTARKQAIEDPKTLSDFRAAFSYQIDQGKTAAEAWLTFTPEQRIAFDELEAESTREARETRKREAKTAIRTAGQAVAGQIVETKHTRDGHDLFVVQLAERLERDDYNTLLASARRIGGNYSSFRGRGAVPGFQFRTRENAEAFLQLAGGDKAAAEAQAVERRDAFEDDRSQSAVERLTEMADRLEQRADESLNADRKTNTARRAGMAARAEASARQDKALAMTMRNIAGAIESGSAKFLDAVRQKAQVELLETILTTAKDDELRAKYPSYADQLAHKGEPATAETADYAAFPRFTAFRSDLAALARQMLETDGTKKLGQRLMSVADDVSEAYIEFAKANLNLVATFSTGSGERAAFTSRDAAETAIRRSKLIGKAMVLPVKRGENVIVLSPSEAMNRGLWTGDGDKRITLKREFAAELINQVGKAKRGAITVPWQFESAHQRLGALARMGIETPAEFRSALREFIRLREQPAAADKIKEMERAMVGRRNDGLDFFPTPEAVADAMVDAAELQPGMRVLEPSAGMGHIAERIREAGLEPDVVEFSSERRELLAAKGFNVIGDDFMATAGRDSYDAVPRADLERAEDAARGEALSMVRSALHFYDKGDMEGAALLISRAMKVTESTPFLEAVAGLAERLRGAAAGQYDRILMNPPFSDRRDAAHIQHAYSLLKPGGKLVAIAGEGVFFGSDKKAQAFREWLDELGATVEKLPAGTFNDPSLPVNTSVSARMIVIERPTDTRYRLDGGGSTAADGKGVAPFTARAIARKLAAISDLRFEVVATEADLPATARRDIERDGVSGQVTGIFHEGTSYLIADRLQSAQHAISLVLHEAVGHGGVKAVLGDKLGRTMRDIYRSIPAIERNELEQRYAGQIAGLGLEQAQELVAEEYVAQLAESNPQHSIISRLVALLRRFIRDTFGERVALQWSRADLVQLLAEARRAAAKGAADAGAIRYRDGAEALALPEVSEVDEADFVASLGDSSSRAFAGALYKAQGTKSLFFQKWFGESRMRTREGTPIAFYHRSYDERATFDDNALGKNTGTPAAALGHYLARKDVGNVERYGPVAERFYVRMVKPKVISQDEFMAMGDWSVEQVVAYRQRLMAQGFDGIYIQGLAWPVVFEGKNIKAVRNVGTFDSTNRVRFALDESLVAKQFAATAEAYGGEAAWRAARNVGATELDYRQWVQVRTPAFKQWFGDWQNGNDQGGTGGARSAQEGGNVRRGDGSVAQADAGTAGAAGREWRLHPTTGEPRVFHHGTRDEFTSFDVDHPNRKDKGWLGRGVYTASDRRMAEGYAKLKAGQGEPRVMDLFVNVRNPAVGTLQHKQALRNASQEFIDQVTADLRAKGHDGVVLELPDGTLELMAFDPVNVKSATENTGTFDVAQADIRYSLTDFIGRREPFQLTADNAKRTLKGRIADLKPAMLGALPLNYLRDFAPQSMTALTAYMDEKRAMDADRNEMHTRYDAIAQRWLKLRWSDRKAEQRLADLMHAATLEGVDPSKPMKDSYTPEQKAAYNRLRMQYQSLPEGHRAMFGEARDAYKQQISTLEGVIEENIRKSAEYAKKRARRDRDADIQRAKDELTGEELAEALEAAEKRYNGRVASAEKGGSAKILLLRQKFESMRVDEPYFPLKRYGDYFVAMRDGDELVSFSMFESAADMEAAAAELRKTYPNLSVKVGRQSNKQVLEGAVDPAFIADLQDVVSRMPNSKELSDQIYQMYLETMPDFSMRKGFIHRKKTAGFDRDAMRAFASSMFHSSYQIARLKHSLEMNELVEQVEEQAKASADPVDAMTIANELRKRHEWVMSPKSGKVAQHITSAAFVYQLGITPAAALVNTTQTFMMGIPVLGARFGSEVKATAALAKASADFVKGRGHLERSLQGQEAAAFAEFMRMGLIDKTQAHDLAGVGETGVEYNPVRHKVMGYISWAFHNAERYNREVTVMAAYRMGRENGLDHEAAIKEAAELTWTTHFDYSSSNRARYMQNDTAKVLLVFRQHSINMLSRLVIDLRGAMKGETPEVKRLAKRRLAGMFAMFGLFAGVMGVPGVMAILALLDLFDDDDDPWSTEDKMKRNLVEALGPDVAAVVLGGLPGTVSDLSLTERIGMGYLWFRPAGRELEGKDAYLYWMEQVLGAAPAMVSNTFTGISMIGEGHVWRGIEAMMPKAIKDAMRAGRYTQEGVLTMDGTPLVDEVGTWNVISQAMGFTPAHIAERYDTNRALKNAEQHILTERRSILNRYAMAMKQGDGEMRGELLERIQAFNKRYPQYPITGKTISQSLKARAQRQAGAEGGIVLNRRLEFLREQL